MMTCARSHQNSSRSNSCSHCFCVSAVLLLFVDTFSFWCLFSSQEITLVHNQVIFSIFGCILMHKVRVFYIVVFIFVYSNNTGYQLPSFYVKLYKLCVLFVVCLFKLLC